MINEGNDNSLLVSGDSDAGKYDNKGAHEISCTLRWAIWSRRTHNWIPNFLV